ncbi:MAG: T9SS type A sorting domain-containing protein [Bacteroidales bacterium]|nr:T9SS type A sorting domain-containing protein [Bacteroidales bacterium]
MKKIIISMLVLTAWATSLSAQITREQADAIVWEHLQDEVTPPYFLYVNVNTPTVEGIAITTPQGEAMLAKYACWAYYLNENPVMSAPSQHRYLFVKEDDGNLLEVITSNDLVPELTDWTEVTTGIVETDNYPSLRIYPNPTDGMLYITDYRHCGLDPQSPENDEIAGQARNDIKHVDVFDVMGRTVHVEMHGCASLQWRQQQPTTTLDISELPTGIYFLHIQTDNGVITRKIIKY